MNKWNALIVLLLAGTLFAACQKKAVNSAIPQISFKSLTKDSVTGGSANDGIVLSFSFVDGDGDIGTSRTSTTIFMIDSRDTFMRRYPFPFIEDPEAHDPIDGTQGDGEVLLTAATLLPRTDTLHTRRGDTVRFETYIIDNAGHESNRFTTPNIYIRPQ